MSAVRALYLKAEDICRVYRKLALDRHLLSEEDVAAYEASHLAPVFHENQRKDSIQHWAHCDLVYREYEEVFPELAL